MARTRPARNNEDQADSATPGWGAIDAACRRLYGRQRPAHYGVLLSARLGGDHYLDGISAYKATEPAPHWHFVSYGMSELYDKESDNPDVSGWGFEFTFRLARKKAEKEPPAWALNVLQNLARYVYRSGNPFGPFHHMDLNGPIALGTDTAIRAVAFAEDPELKAINTPNGRLRFLQIVGLTKDELDALTAWNARGFLKVLRRVNPKLLTDLGRGSVLVDPKVAKAVAAKTAAEGSSQTGVYVSRAEWAAKGKAVTVTLGAIAVPQLARLLRGRIPFGRPFDLTGAKQVIEFAPGRRPGLSAKGDRLVVRVSPALAEEIAAGLPAERGKYRWPALAGLTVRVVPTKVTDADGTVTEEIG